MFGACILVATAVFVALVKTLGFGIGILIIVLPGLLVGGLLNYFVIPYISEKLEVWSNVRSFQATRQAQKGIV